MHLLHNVIFEQTKVWLIMNVMLSALYGIAAVFFESRPDGKALFWICCGITAGIAVYQINALARKRNEAK